jgi:hypothetical protein
MSYKASNEFVPKEIADLVKSKGFDLNCLGIYSGVDDVMTSGERKGFNSGHVYYEEHGAPLYQQVTDWFETIHNLYIYAFRCNGKWDWKIDDDFSCLDFGSVEGGKKENLIAAIKKACSYNLNDKQ